MECRILMITVVSVGIKTVKRWKIVTRQFRIFCKISVKNLIYLFDNIYNKCAFLSILNECFMFVTNP